jgi:hypothetical protein
MRYIAVMIWFNGFGKRVAQIIEEENTSNPKYFENIEEIKTTTNPRFPGDIVCINLDTLETETLY